MVGVVLNVDDPVVLVEVGDESQVWRSERTQVIQLSGFGYFRLYS